MLKSYEAIYKNGMLRWLEPIPAQLNNELRVLVVVEVNEAQQHTYGSLEKQALDPEMAEMWQKWLNGNRKKPQGGRLRPRILGKTVAERVLEDRGE
jgi:predicted DNA-binding antitoxin AbrB/MazE fold protein